MGKTATELEREIAEVRRDTELIVDELERRAHRLLDFWQQAEAHPTAAMAVGAGLVLALGVGLYGLYEVLRPKPAPAAGLVGGATRLARQIREHLPIQISVETKRTAERQPPGCRA